MEVEHVECFQPAALLKVTLLYGCFSRFLNCTNDTNSRNVLNYVRVMETKLYLEILTVLWIKWAEIVEKKHKGFIDVVQTMPCQNLPRTMCLRIYGEGRTQNPVSSSATICLLAQCPGYTGSILM